MVETWTECRIGDISTGIFDGPHATPTKTDSGPVFLGISSLDRGRLDLAQSAHLSEADFAKWTRRVTPQCDDFVFSYETRLGQAALIPPGLRCCLGRRMALVRVDQSRMDPRFFLYQYLGPEFQDLLRSRTVSGSTVDRILLTEFPDFVIKVPPLDEQRAIASVLGALDDKIEANRALNETLEATGEMTFQRVCGTYLDQPEHLKPCSQLIDEGALLIGDGYRAKRSELDSSGLPFARAANIRGGFHFDNVELLGHASVSKAKHKVSSTFDVVFTSKGSVGRFAYVSESTPKFVYSPQLCFWRSKSVEVLQPSYLLYWMRSHSFLRQVDQVKGQTDMADYVSLTDQKRMMVTVPEQDVQRAVSGVLDPIQRLCASLFDQNQTLAAVRDLLLPRLLSGEVRVKQAEKLVEEAV